MKLTKDVKANIVVKYYDIYKRYIAENGLEDDSKSISVFDLLYFVDNIIPEDFN